MKKAFLIAIFSFVAQLSMGQAHDKKFNFDYITYAFGGEYQENVPTDNVHFTGYLNIGFSQFVYFPNNVYTDAYAVNQFNYISAETKPRKMQAYYDKDNNVFVVHPFQDVSSAAFFTTKDLKYRATKEGAVGELILN